MVLLCPLNSFMLIYLTYFNKTLVLRAGVFLDQPQYARSSLCVQVFHPKMPNLGLYY